MTLYRNTQDGEIRELDDDLYASWVANGNPKAAAWVALPPKPSDRHTWDGAQWVAPDLAAMAAQLGARIDRSVDAVYAAVIGNRQAEYAEAEAEARAYAAAGYTGTVPPSVASWVQASGLSAQAATDNILATATAWRGAAQTMRAARLGHKAQAKAATTAAQLDAVSASWSATLAQIRAALGL